MTTQLSTIPTPLVNSTYSTSVLKQLVDEFNKMSSQPSCLRHANSWGLPGGPVDNLDEMLRRAGFGRPITCDESDQYLAALVRIAHNDDLALRIVLQRVVPSIISIAKRRGHQRRDEVDAAMSALTAQAWMVIRTYPSERRPRKIASNIVRDTEYKEFVATTRPRKTTVEFHDPTTLATQVSEIGRHEVSISVGPESANDVICELERRKVDTEKIALLKLVATGYTSNEIGEILKMRPRTIRWQRAEALAIAREVHSSR